MELSKRTLLTRLGIGAATISTYPVTASASTTSKDLSGTTVIDHYSVKGHENLLFTALSGTDTVLYYAKGATGITDTADELVQLTDGTEGAVWNLTQISDYAFQYWQNGVVHKLTVGSNGDITSVEPVQENQYPGNVKQEYPSKAEKDASQTPSAIARPPGGGGGGLPDWWNNSEFYKPAQTAEESAELLGYEWFEVEINMGETEPMYKADCNGQTLPLVGASINSITATTFGGEVSISLDLWYGVDPTTGCVYLGSDTGDFCFQDCGINLASATEATIKNAIDGVIDGASEAITDGLGALDDLDTSDLILAAAGVVAVALLALCAPGIVAVISAILATGTMG